jgi:hypothetical protein
MGRRLSTPVEVRIRSPLGSDEAFRRIRDAIDGSASIETVSARSDRRLRGTVTPDRVVLSIRDSRFSTRRKSWNIEFEGSLGAGRSGTELVGEIGVSDRRELHIIMWLFRLASLVPAVSAIAIGARESGGFLGSGVTILFAAAIAVIAGFVTVWIEANGEQAAAADSDALTAYLDQLLV